jgi:hypothetical protein
MSAYNLQFIVASILQKYGFAHDVFDIEQSVDILLKLLCNIDII